MFLALIFLIFRVYCVTLVEHGSPHGQFPPLFLVSVISGLSRNGLDAASRKPHDSPDDLGFAGQPSQYWWSSQKDKI